MPDPDERGRAYEATRAHVSADAAEQGSYWDEIPRFTQMWADHERRRPERQPAGEPDRPADPAGTYRSRGGFKLDPERHAETIGAIGRMRETEPSISADMQAVEKENACGGWLAGFDRRIKGDDRLKEKVAEQAAAEPDKSSSAILRKIPDALRFTCCPTAGVFVAVVIPSRCRATAARSSLAGGNVLPPPGDCASPPRLPGGPPMNP
jgi:hypothetical protein